MPRLVGVQLQAQTTFRVGLRQCLPGLLVAGMGCAFVPIQRGIQVRLSTTSPDANRRQIGLGNDVPLMGRAFVPAACLIQVTGGADAVFVVPAQVVLGRGQSLLGCLRVPLEGHKWVFVHAKSVCIQMPESGLGVTVTAPGLALPQAQAPVNVTAAKGLHTIGKGPIFGPQ